MGRLMRVCGAVGGEVIRLGSSGKWHRVYMSGCSRLKLRVRFQKTDKAMYYLEVDTSGCVGSSLKNVLIEYI